MEPDDEISVPADDIAEPASSPCQAPPGWWDENDFTPQRKLPRQGGVLYLALCGSVFDAGV
jgi:hypothetical protein